jgi:hypothetical protein
MGLAGYALMLLITGVRAAPGDPRQALRLAAVFATMHLSFGFGVFAGMLQFGVPRAGATQALRAAARRED